METNVHASNTTGLRPGAILAMSIAAAALTAVFPLCWILLPGLWAYGMLRTKPLYVLFPAVVFLFFSYYLVRDWLFTACLGGMGLLSALCIYYGQQKKLGNAYTALFTAGVGLVSLYLITCLPSLLAGEGAFAGVQASVDQVVDGFEQMLALTPNLTGEMTAAYQEYLALVRSSVGSLVVPILSAAGGVYGLANFLFFRLFARKQAASLPKMRPFKDWSIPGSLATGLFILLIGSLVLTWTGWDYADAFSATVNVIVGMPLILQGLATIDFLICKKGRSVTGRRVAVYVIAGVFFWLAQMPLMLVGCFEQLFRFRTRQIPAA